MLFFTDDFAEAIGESDTKYSPMFYLLRIVQNPEDTTMSAQFLSEMSGDVG